MITVLESLNSALHRAMAEDKRVLLLGEDILDPYGGAFKVSHGLSEIYPVRVLTTPISEAGIVGTAAGMALRGLRPVVEIMFGDFLTLAADQLINHATKFRWMYNEQVRVPMVVRTPMGGRRGYGPTHSQTLEKHFLGVPGLNVLAPTLLGDPGRILYEAILKGEDPTLFIENKLLYLLQIQAMNDDPEFEIQELNGVSILQYPGFAPTYVLRVRQAPQATLTLATYGYMLKLVRQAALELAYEHEVFIEILAPTRLAPFEVQPIIESVGRTGKLVTVEEGTHDMGWGAEVLAQVAESLGSKLLASERIAALDLPIPSSKPLEDRVLPGVEQIIQTCLRTNSRR
jgi:pyruvate/2-oxoglutarate/acetoin dehydrogenase E1 component